MAPAPLQRANHLQVRQVKLANRRLTQEADCEQHRVQTRVARRHRGRAFVFGQWIERE